MSVLGPLLYLAVGLLLWPFVEYLIHGVLAHGLRTPVSPLHWGHHRAPERVFTSPLAWLPVLALVFGGLAALLDAPRAAALSAGLLAGFLRYEYVHWRIHFRAPRSEREALRRAHHLAHHHLNPRAYYAVSNRLLDRLFGSLPEQWESDYAAVAEHPPLGGSSNLGQLIPRG